MSSNPTNAFGETRAQILRQHEELHRLMNTAVVLSGAAARGDGACQAELPLLLEMILGKLGEHTAFEEDVLVPVLALHGVLDISDSNHLLEEHLHQRNEVAGVLELARSGQAPDTTARALVSLHHDLLSDIVNEERWLLALDHRTLRRTLDDDVAAAS